MSLVDEEIASRALRLVTTISLLYFTQAQFGVEEMDESILWYGQVCLQALKLYSSCFPLSAQGYYAMASELLLQVQEKVSNASLSQLNQHEDCFPPNQKECLASGSTLNWTGQIRDNHNMNATSPNIKCSNPDTAQSHSTLDFGLRSSLYAFDLYDVQAWKVILQSEVKFIESRQSSRDRLELQNFSRTLESNFTLSNSTRAPEAFADDVTSNPNPPLL